MIQVSLVEWFFSPNDWLNFYFVNLGDYLLMFPRNTPTKHRNSQQHKQQHSTLWMHLRCQDFSQ